MKGSGLRCSRSETLRGSSMPCSNWLLVRQTKRIGMQSRRLTKVRRVFREPAIGRQGSVERAKSLIPASKVSRGRFAMVK